MKQKLFVIALLLLCKLSLTQDLSLYENIFTLPRYSEEMVKAIKEAKASVKFTLYPEANHNSWDSAFAEPELLTWLFSQHK